MTAVTRRLNRRPNDFYPSPDWATKILLDRCPEICGILFEPCAGAGDISKVLQSDRHTVVTNDIAPQIPMDYSLDATDRQHWELWQNKWEFDWAITNPPFSLASSIVPLAYEYADRGIAMLLRLSWLEPCQNRSAFLRAHPPNKLLVLPRISFTGDGKTDSVTCCWLIWDKQSTEQSIEIVTLTS